MLIENLSKFTTYFRQVVYRDSSVLPSVFSFQRNSSSSHFEKIRRKFISQGKQREAHTSAEVSQIWKLSAKNDFV